MQENKPPGDPKTGDPETNDARRQRMAKVAKTLRPGEDPYVNDQAERSKIVDTDPKEQIQGIKGPEEDRVNTYYNILVTMFSEPTVLDAMKELNLERPTLEMEGINKIKTKLEAMKKLGSFLE